MLNLQQIPDAITDHAEESSENTAGIDTTEQISGHYRSRSRQIHNTSMVSFGRKKAANMELHPADSNKLIRLFGIDSVLNAGTAKFLQSEPEQRKTTFLMWLTIITVSLHMAISLLNHSDQQKNTTSIVNLGSGS